MNLFQAAGVSMTKSPKDRPERTSGIRGSDYIHWKYRPWEWPVCGSDSPLLQSLPFLDNKVTKNQSMEANEDISTRSLCTEIIPHVENAKSDPPTHSSI